MNLSLSKLAAAAVVALAATGANANLITNGDFSAGETAWNTLSGFFTEAGGAGFLIGANVAADSITLANNTTYLLTFDAVGSGAVDLDSLDYALCVGSSCSSGPINFTSNSGSASFAYTFTTGSNVNEYTHLFFGTASALALDNVSVSAVPEPETYAMMLAGLGAIGFMARRRKQ